MDREVLLKNEEKVDRGMLGADGFIGRARAAESIEPSSACMSTEIMKACRCAMDRQRCFVRRCDKVLRSHSPSAVIDTSARRCYMLRRCSDRSAASGSAHRWSWQTISCSGPQLCPNPDPRKKKKKKDERKQEQGCSGEDLAAKRQRTVAREGMMPAIRGSSMLGDADVS